MHVPPRLQGKLLSGQRFTLEPLRQTLARLNHPEQQFPAVLISGTNGKGSTLTFLTAMLRTAGLPVGSFTSPSLADVRELVRIDGQVLSPLTFERLCDEVLLAGQPDGLTLFELVTAVAFLSFARARVPLAVIEVGMGGRQDATNLCQPVLSIITRIALDHTPLLGDSEAAIAHEKAGILRPGAPLLTGATGEGLRVLQQHAQRLGCPLFQEGEAFCWSEPGRFEWRGTLERPGDGGTTGALAAMRLGLAGEHQWQNAGLALGAVWLLRDLGWAIGDEAIREGLQAAYIPGRLERLTMAPGVPVWLDGAHNPDGMATLVAFLREQSGRSALPRPRVGLLAVFDDKDLEGMLTPLLPLLEGIVCTTTASVRALTPASLAQAVRRVMPGLPVGEAPSVGAGLEGLSSGAFPAVTGGAQLPGSVLACGSLSLVAEVHLALGSHRVRLPLDGREL